MRIRTVLSVTMVVALASGCDGPGVANPGNPLIGRVGGSPAPAANVAGSWRREVFFLDEFNFARSSETLFQFNADGSFVRVQTARNLTLGTADALVSTGTWSVSGTSIIMEFITPSPSELSLSFTITDNELVIAGESYLRVVN